MWFTTVNLTSSDDLISEVKTILDGSLLSVIYALKSHQEEVLRR